jgi:hypothetical protein
LRYSLFPSIHGKIYGKNQEERKVRKKVKKNNSQKLGKGKTCFLQTLHHCKSS